MTGIAAATIGAGVLAAGASAYSASKQSEAAGQAAGVAGQNAAMQNYLTAQQLRRQNELATATQVDAEGNKLVYDQATNSWIPLLSERGMQVQAAGQAAQDIERRNYFGRGQWEDRAAESRRLGEGGEARKLLDTMRNQYGAPTREGVEGANRVYGATAASEPADLIKSGAAQAQLRQGTGGAGLTRNFNALDKSSAQGIRTALAKPQTGEFDSAFSAWRDPLQASYKGFAAGAAPPGQAPPGTGTEALNASILARAGKGQAADPRVGYGSNEATKQLLAAMGANKGIDYGAGITSIAKLGLEYWKDQESKSSKTNPVLGQGGTITKTGSKEF